MADQREKSDPTVSSTHSASSSAKGRSGSEQPHEARPVSEADDAAANKTYSDAPDKPDVTTVAQVEDTE